MPRNRTRSPKSQLRKMLKSGKSLRKDRNSKKKIRRRRNVAHFLGEKNPISASTPVDSENFPLVANTQPLAKVETVKKQPVLNVEEKSTLSTPVLNTQESGLSQAEDVAENVSEPDNTQTAPENVLPLDLPTDMCPPHDIPLMEEPTVSSTSMLDNVKIPQHGDQVDIAEAGNIVEPSIETVEEEKPTETCPALDSQPLKELALPSTRIAPLVEDVEGREDIIGVENEKNIAADTKMSPAETVDTMTKDEVIEAQKSHQTIAATVDKTVAEAKKLLASLGDAEVVNPETAKKHGDNFSNVPATRSTSEGEGPVDTKCEVKCNMM
ncbi:hypothetical protein AAMO2058_000148200 [Amorphochlora amoebiformis]